MEKVLSVHQSRVTPPQTAFKISHLDFMEQFAAISGHKHVT